MSALAITASLIALSTNCAATVAPGTTLSFARVESGLDPLAIHSNADGRAIHPATKAEAVAIASSMIARGERPDLGFMQINRGNLPWLALSFSDERWSTNGVLALNLRDLGVLLSGPSNNAAHPVRCTLDRDRCRDPRHAS